MRRDNEGGGWMVREITRREITKENDGDEDEKGGCRKENKG